MRGVYQLMSRFMQNVRVGREYYAYKRLAAEVRPEFAPVWKNRWFQPYDGTANTEFDRHYVYHTAWAIRVIVRRRPQKHIDVSSSLYFVALGSSVVPMEHFDFRPPKLHLDSLQCMKGDLDCLQLPADSVSSLSCMHVLEHIGLGRYGDRIDPLGDVKGAAELVRVLAPGGQLLIVVPVGRARVCFNAHRVYSFEQVLKLFEPLDLEEWAILPDQSDDGLIASPSADLVNSQEYGCGCFVFRKRRNYV